MMTDDYHKYGDYEAFSYRTLSNLKELINHFKQTHVYDFSTNNMFVIQSNATMYVVKYLLHAIMLKIYASNLKISCS